jgi:hypothetical protein
MTEPFTVHTGPTEGSNTMGGGTTAGDLNDLPVIETANELDDEMMSVRGRVDPDGNGNLPVMIADLSTGDEHQVASVAVRDDTLYIEFIRQ